MGSTSAGRRAELRAVLERANRTSVLLTVLHMHAIATRAGINITDVQCLNLLTLDGPATPSRLAKTMAISKGGAVTAMIDRLEKAGYIRRTRDPHDRRQVLIEIVDGEPIRRLTELFRPIGEATADVLTDYTDEQVELIANFMTRSNNAIMKLRHDD